MTKLLKELTEFFAKQPSALEAFINSKKPTNVAEVEYWARYFESKGL